MAIENDMTLYRYTVKNGKFFIREGTVNHTGFRPLVNFKDGSPMLRCPKEEDFGKIKSVGRSLWLTERDDEYARMKFIEYELDKIDKLREQINRKYKTIDMLRNGMG